MTVAGTTYDDPTDGHSVVVLEAPEVLGAGTIAGFAYSPLRATPPVPWHGGCHHCRSGRQTDVTIHVKREIQMLISRKVETESATSYYVPSNSIPHHVVHRREPDGLQRIEVDPGTEELLVVTYSSPGEISYQGDRSTFYSKILRRCLRFLLSGRPSTREEIASCAKILATMPSQAGKRNPCKRINWLGVLSSMTH